MPKNLVPPITNIFNLSPHKFPFMEFPFLKKHPGVEPVPNHQLPIRLISGYGDSKPSTL